MTRVESDCLSKYNEWLLKAPEDLQAELRQIQNNHREITERFYQDIKFGTAGLRGRMGAGANRMNALTVGRAAAGLAATLKKKSVVIAYDNRLNSRYFAETAAAVLLAAGVQVRLFPTLVPTPLLSFAVRQLQCGAGIMITASHNGYEYNGFKCYGADGCQMTEAAADRVLRAMAEIDFFTLPVADCGAAALERQKGFGYVADEVVADYCKQILWQRRNPEILRSTDLRVLYTPLSGTGGKAVMRVLRDCGVKNLQALPCQQEPDGYFTTCPNPNPEEPDAYAEALKYAENHPADLILATDPDADRLGVMTAAEGGYKLLSGNEIGCLLLDYLLESAKQQGRLPTHPIVFKTLVTTPMAEKIAADYGCRVKNLLVGFKYICEQVQSLAAEGRTADFIIGFEESNGYLCGDYTGDKDGVLAAMLTVELAAYYQAEGLSLAAKLEQLYRRYGYYRQVIDNIVFDGKSGTEKMAAFMAAQHAEPLERLGDRRVVMINDYQLGQSRDLRTGATAPIDLPCNDMIEYRFADDCSLVIRPSGTEPKLKLYFNAAAETQALAESAVAEMRQAWHKYIENYADMKTEP